MLQFLGVKQPCWWIGAEVWYEAVPRSADEREAPPRASAEWVLEVGPGTCPRDEDRCLHLRSRSQAQ